MINELRWLQSLIFVTLFSFGPSVADADEDKKPNDYIRVFQDKSTSISKRPHSTASVQTWGMILKGYTGDYDECVAKSDKYWDQILIPLGEVNAWFDSVYTCNWIAGEGVPRIATYVITLLFEPRSPSDQQEVDEFARRHTGTLLDGDYLEILPLSQILVDTTFCSLGHSTELQSYGVCYSDPNNGVRALHKKSFTKKLKSLTEFHEHKRRIGLFAQATTQKELRKGLLYAVEETESYFDQVLYPGAVTPAFRIGVLLQPLMVLSNGSSHSMYPNYFPRIDCSELPDGKCGD